MEIILFLLFLFFSLYLFIKGLYLKGYNDGLKKASQVLQDSIDLQLKDCISKIQSAYSVEMRDANREASYDRAGK